MDDDADCVEHVWAIAGIRLSLGEAATDQRCTRCGAVAYDSDQTDRERRRA